MTLPEIFANVPTDTRVAGSQLDRDLDEVASMMVIPCGASGDDEIALLPFADLPTLTTYLNYQRFAFVAPSTSTAPVTVNFNGFGALPLYKADGITQFDAGDIVFGEYYDIAFIQSLTAGRGGFVGAQASVAQIGPTGPTGPGPGATGPTGATASALTATGPTGPTGAGAFRVIRTQRFTTTGTYTPDANLIYCTIEMVGGGGGGGGISGAGAGVVQAGGGGGAGAYNRRSVSKATIGASKPVTIGAGGAGGTNVPADGVTGGTTSVGTLVTAPGGVGGVTGTGGGSGSQLSAGGLGGANVDSDFNGSTGQPGLSGFGFNPNNLLLTVVGGNGGSGSWGGGGLGRTGFNISSGIGVAAQDFGAGGGGASGTGDGNGRSGGAGQAGLVVITEYCSQ